MIKTMDSETHKGTKVFSLLEFEALVNPETLRVFPSLVEYMDYNLSFRLNDFLQSEIFQEYVPISEGEVLSIVNKSEKYYYDSVNSRIALKEKAKRTMIVFQNFPPNSKSIECVQNFLKEINMLQHVKAFEDAKELVFTYLDTEANALEVYKHIEQGQNNKTVLFNAFIKVENKTRQILKVYEEDPNYRMKMNETPCVLLQDKESERRMTFQNTKVEVDSSSTCYNKRRVSNYEYGRNKFDINRFSETASHNESNSKKNSVRFSENTGNLYSQYFTNKKLNARKASKQMQASMNRKSRLSCNQQHIMLNKDYDVDLDNKVTSDGKVLKTVHPNISHVYETKEIVSVYFHMNFLYKFECPEQFEDNFLEEIMRQQPKKGLDQFRENKQLVPRERSQTYFQYKKRHSSLGKYKHSFCNKLNERKSISKRKRYESLQIKR